MTDRTIQDLLGERRAYVREMLGERDVIALKLLDYQVAEIDRELGRRRKAELAAIWEWFTDVIGGQP